MAISSIMVLAILPVILLFLLGALILTLSLIIHKEDNTYLGWVTAVGAGLIIFLSLPAHPEGHGQIVWGGMLRYDWLGYVFSLLFIFGVGITALFAMNYKEVGSRTEFYLLLIASAIGMCFMASSADLIMLYLAIETTSIPLYILAGFMKDNEFSVEAGFKYLLFGAMTSAIMLYGFSLLFGFASTTDMYLITHNIIEGGVKSYILLGSFFLVLVGFAFKISGVPMHFWAPDIYQGAPTPIAGFLSTASKAAGFAVILRFMLVVFPSISFQWGAVLSAMAVATMTLGNFLALPQKNIKRLLAYSSIAHAGYALVGVVAISELGVTSTIYYLIAYLFTNLAAFGVVAATGRILKSDDMTAYYGLSRRSPGLALVMLVAFLSLAGMPPFGGFVSKVFVFSAAVKADLVWLAVVGVLNSIIGLFYYLTVLKYVYLYRSEGDEIKLNLTSSYKLGFVILTVLILVIGIIFNPWFNIASNAAFVF